MYVMVRVKHEAYCKLILLSVVVSDLQDTYVIFDIDLLKHIWLNGWKRLVFPSRYVVKYPGLQ